MNFPACTLCDPTCVANALTFDNANACCCESFPCIHDRFHKQFVRRKVTNNVENIIEEETSLFNSLNVNSESPVDVTNQTGGLDYLDTNDNEVFYTGKPINFFHNSSLVNRSKTVKDLPEVGISGRSLVHGGSESFIPNYDYGFFDRIFSQDRSSNDWNGFISDIHYCQHVSREVKQKELGQYLNAKKRKEETSDSNSSDSDSEQSSSSTETTSSESSDSSCSSSSSSSSTSSSSESDDEDDSSTESESSGGEANVEKMRLEKKQKKSR